MGTFGQFIDFERFEGAMSPDEFDRRGQARRQPNRFLRRAKVLACATGVLGFCVAAYDVGGNAVDSEYRVEGSNAGAYCVEDPVVPDGSYEARQGAIRVNPGDFVDTATVGVRETLSGEYEIQGKRC